CPRLESLDLQFCGRLNGGTLQVLAQGLPQLSRVRLDGAFLVADEEWAAFFRTMGEQLRMFTAAFAGFGPVAMRALVSHCTQLEALRLVECTEFDDDCLGMLAWPITELEETLQDAERQLRADSDGAMPPWKSLTHLRSLELLRPHKPMTNMTAKRVLREIGSHLHALDVAGFRDVMDDFADELATHTCGLQELGMASCDSISSEAMVRVFGHMRATQTLKAHHGLTRVDLSRCYMLTDQVVQELVRLAGSSLRQLSLNSVDDNLTQRGLLALGGFMYAEDDGLQEQTLGCTVLEELDVSWVRSMTDEVLGQIVPRCKHLARIDVYGCGGVTAFAPARPGLKYVGRECDTL
ncbi:UV-damaged DNA-binding protein rad7, partial [Coemansia brasiliensis]